MLKALPDHLKQKLREREDEQEMSIWPRLAGHMCIDSLCHNPDQPSCQSRCGSRMVDEKQNVVSVKFLTMEDPDFVEEEEAVMFVSKCTVMMCNKMLGQKWLFDGSKKAMEQS